MITWQELRLAKQAKVEFPDGTRADLHLHREKAPLEARHNEYATLLIEGNSQLRLDDCVDSSPNCEAPWVLVVSGRPQDRVLLFGGEVVYVVSSEARVCSQTRLFRARRNVQFWRTKVVGLAEESLLIDYEVGALVIESTLEIRWHVETALIDFFERKERSGLVFLRDHEVPFAVDIATGAGVPEIAKG